MDGGGASFFEQGYGPLSFIGLYLLGKYLKLYFTFKSKFNWMCAYWLYAIIISILFYLCINRGIKINIYAYNNPLVIIGSSFLVLWAANLKIKINNILNWVSKSAFAVYLFHCNPYLLGIYLNKCRDIYNTYHGIECIAIMSVFVLAVFAVSILLDQPRKWLWKLLQKL